MAGRTVFLDNTMNGQGNAGGARQNRSHFTVRNELFFAMYNFEEMANKGKEGMRLQKRVG